MLADPTIDVAICDCAKIALIVAAGSLAPVVGAVVGAVCVALADVELEAEDDDEEFAPNSVKSWAADRPPKEFNEESMLRLSPSGNSHRRGRFVRLAIMAKYDLGVPAYGYLAIKRCAIDFKKQETDALIARSERPSANTTS